MANYTKIVDYAAKDALNTGDPVKLVKGTEIGAEYDAIATAIATKANSASPTFTGVSGFAVGAVGAPSIYMTGYATTGWYNIGANNWGFAVSGAKVLDIASTGLSVTGTLSATGDVTASGGNLLLSSGGTIPLRISGATTGSSVARIQNTGGDAIFGQESSAGNALIIGCSAYDTIIRGSSGLAFSANAGSAMQMRLSSTGLAVTGALSATGTLSTIGLITSTAAAQSALFNNAVGSYATWQYNGTSNGDVGTANQAVSGGSTADFAITSRAGNLILGSGTTTRVTVSSVGIAVTGDISVSTKTPASAAAAGVAGTITWDANYLYVCTATNTWKRVAIATW